MANRLFLAGLGVFLAGFGLIMASTLTQGGASAGGVIFIGPVPLVFGSGPGGLALGLGSLLIGAVMILLLLFLGWRSREMKEA